MANPIAQVKTPSGELKWVIITGEGRENMSGKMKYTADICMPEDSKEAQALKAQIDEFWKANKPANFKKKAKSLGYRQEMKKVLDADGEETYNEEGEVVYEPTGMLKFTFATDTTWAKSGDAKVIKIYNSKGNPVNLGDKKIGNGSVGNIGGAMGIYTVEAKGTKTITDAGVTLYLNSIRIIKLEEYSQDEQWDDAGEEGGWTGENNWDEEGTPEDSKPEGGTPRL